ncbi:hypothetical protein KY317_01050 [Candidatus Woesearchaeota archaeon]|nr:hypothetical protein [Candidatus Woesearchaeota archaeon]
MAKCEICKKKIEQTFLGKFKGTIIRDKSAKSHTICFECQKKFKTKEEILKQL